MEIIAHRGASHDAPENTLAAVRLAWEQGADAVEVDVHLTADGRLAVIHDPDTRRTAGVARVVAHTALAELQRLDVGGWKGEAFAGEPIPSLEQVLGVVPGGRRIFIELKSGPEAVPELARCLAVCPALLPEQVTAIAFDLEVAVSAKRALPATDVCWLADSGRAAPRATLDEIADIARDAGLDGIDVHRGWQIGRELAGRIRSRGLKLYVWTVDDPGLARRLRAAGLDGLTTNRPAWLRAQLAG